MKFKTQIFTIFTLFSCTVFAQQTVVNGAVAKSSQLTAHTVKNHANNAKQALQRLLGKLNHFQSDFVQRIFDEQGKLIQQSKGKLSVAKPNKLNWHTIEPDESILTSDGKALYLYDPFIEQVSIYGLDSAIANTPILLLSDSSAKTWQKFNVSQQHAEQFVISAKDIDSQIKSLTLSFKNQQLVAMAFVDATGQKSEINLSNLQPINADKLFEFTIPAGATVDDQR